MSVLRSDTDFNAWIRHVSAETELLCLKTKELDVEKVRLSLLQKFCDASLLRHSKKAGIGTTTAKTLESELRAIWVREQTISWSDLEITVTSRNDLNSFRDVVRKLSYLNSFSEDLALDRLYRSLSQNISNLVKSQRFSTVDDAISWIIELDLLADRKVLAAAGERRRPITCFFCKKEGHIKRNCYSFLRQTPKNSAAAAQYGATTASPESEL